MYKLITESARLPQEDYFRLKTKTASGLQADGEKLPAAPDAKPVLTVDRTAHRQLHQLVKNVSMHQGFEVGANAHIGGGFLGDRDGHHSQRVLETCLDLFVDVGGKA